jgi:hypothetical protein
VLGLLGVGAGAAVGGPATADGPRSLLVAHGSALSSGRGLLFFGAREIENFLDVQGSLGSSSVRACGGGSSPSSALAKAAGVGIVAADGGGVPAASSSRTVSVPAADAPSVKVNMTAMPRAASPTFEERPITPV